VHHARANVKSEFVLDSAGELCKGQGMADLTRVVTIGASPIVPTEIAGLPAWAKGRNPTSIVLLSAGSVYVVAEGEAENYTAAAANELRAAAAPLEFAVPVRSINGTGGSPASSAMDIMLGWDR
jgi:hypothetical protein